MNIEAFAVPRSAAFCLVAALLLGSTPAWSNSNSNSDSGPGIEPDAPAQSEQSGEAPVSLAPVAIIGSAAAARNVPGGATWISEQDLEKFEFTDIQRVLRQVPGVSIQLEDGFGLRPNISIRGTPSDRSRAVTLLEDGVPIPPPDACKPLRCSRAPPQFLKVRTPPAARST